MTSRIGTGTTSLDIREDRLSLVDKWRSTRRGISLYETGIKVRKK